MNPGSFCHRDVLIFETFRHNCTVSNWVGMFRNDFVKVIWCDFLTFDCFLASIQLMLSTVLSNASHLIVDV